MRCRSLVTQARHLLSRRIESRTEKRLPAPEEDPSELRFDRIQSARVGNSPAKNCEELQ